MLTSFKFLPYSEHNPTPGPLHLLFALPQWPHGSSFTSFRSIFKCHLLSESVKPPYHLMNDCTSPISHMESCFFSPSHHHYGTLDLSFKKKNSYYLFIWLYQVLIMAHGIFIVLHGIFCCGAQTPELSRVGVVAPWHVGS